MTRQHHVPAMTGSSPVAKAREAVCNRVGANIYGRAEQFLRLAEIGDDAGARAELLALLRFFPKQALPIDKPVDLIDPARAFEPGKSTNWLEDK